MRRWGCKSSQGLLLKQTLEVFCDFISMLWLASANFRVFYSSLDHNDSCVFKGEIYVPVVTGNKSIKQSLP